MRYFFKFVPLIGVKLLVRGLVREKNNLVGNEMLHKVWRTLLLEIKLDKLG